MVEVTLTSDIAPVSSKEFLDIHATMKCRFTLKRVRNMMRTYSQRILVVSLTIYKQTFPKLQSATKIVRLAFPAPLFNVGCKFACSFLATTAWRSLSRLGTTLSEGKGTILDIFEQV